MCHSKKTKGHGQYMFDQESGQAEVVKLNKDFPNLKHWLEEEPEKPKKICVAWEEPGGEKGKGEYMDKDQAQAWLKEANKEQPNLKHWLEEEPEKQKKYRIAWEKKE